MDGCGGGKGGNGLWVFFFFRGLRTEMRHWKKKQVCSENRKEKKWESGIEIFNERSIKSKQYPREGWAKWRVGKVARSKNWDEVWKWGIGRSTRILRWLILKKKKPGCQAACLSLHPCAPLFSSPSNFSGPHFMQSGESWVLLSFKTSFKSNTMSEQVGSYILRKTFWLWCNFSSLRLQPLRRFTAKCCCLGAAAKVLPNNSDHIYYLAARSCELQFGGFVDSCGEAFRWMALVCVIHRQAVRGHPPAEGLGADCGNKYSR